MTRDSEDVPEGHWRAAFGLVSFFFFFFLVLPPLYVSTSTIYVPYLDYWGFSNLADT